jgi:hypothetical protein
MPSEADTLFLREKVFVPVAERVKDRRDSLSGAARFLNSGIEGWLKVEAARALGDRVKKFCNTGPDLQLADDFFIELKGATNCSSYWILGGLKYSTQPQYRCVACLFLGDGGATRISACVEELHRRSTVVAHETFSAGTGEWIIGLIASRAGTEPDAAMRTGV